MKAYWLTPEGGDARWMFVSVDTIKADASQTQGAFAAVHVRAFAGLGLGPPLHVHAQFDNGLFVVDGTFTFVVDDDTFVAGPGTWVFVPRGVPRTFRCDSTEGHLLSITTPAGFEEFYREAGEPLLDNESVPAPSEPDVEVVGPMAARYGLSIVGPPMP